VTSPIPWEGIDLVVFDVDGTLYDQRRLRLAMLGLLLADALRTRSLATLRTLRTFRRVRESLGDAPAEAFMQEQYARTALRHGMRAEDVERLASEWLERRPLPMLAACRYPHVDALFAALLRSGKQVAVFSDYPASAKLEALGLQAGHVVCATDPHIGRLKPDPAGLLAIMRACGASPQRTLMVGDRADRDGAAARRAGAHALIRSARPIPGHLTFRSFDDLVFRPVMDRQAVLAGS
jgi:HAD superfamily hydrolase (TIGR01549 family)